jgi:hypothetical protein
MAPAKLAHDKARAAGLSMEICKDMLLEGVTMMLLQIALRVPSARH